LLQPFHDQGKLFSFYTEINPTISSLREIVYENEGRRIPKKQNAEIEGAFNNKL
jgi:hypothetical protein